MGSSGSCHWSHHLCVHDCVLINTMVTTICSSRTPHIACIFAWVQCVSSMNHFIFRSASNKCCQSSPSCSVPLHCHEFCCTSRGLQPPLRTHAYHIDLSCLPTSHVVIVSNQLDACHEQDWAPIPVSRLLNMGPVSKHLFKGVPLDLACDKFAEDFVFQLSMC